MELETKNKTNNTTKDMPSITEDNSTFAKINFMANLNLVSTNMFEYNIDNEQTLASPEEQPKNKTQSSCLHEEYSGKFTTREWKSIIHNVNKHRMTLLQINPRDNHKEAGKIAFPLQHLVLSEKLQVNLTPNGKIITIQRLTNKQMKKKKRFMIKNNLVQLQGKRRTLKHILRMTTRPVGKSISRRSTWTLEQLLAYRKREAERAKQRRQHFTEQQLLAYRRRCAAYNRAYRARMSKEQIEECRRRHREQAREKRAKRERERIQTQNPEEENKPDTLEITTEQMEEHCKREMLKQQERLQSETDIERALRLSNMAKRAREKYAERKARLAAQVSNEVKARASHREFKNSWSSPCICVLCYDNVECKADLRQHFLTAHHLHIPFSCGLCWRSFKERNEMMMHRNLAHRQQEHLNCTICKKHFPSYQKLLSHTRVHLSHKSIYQKEKPRDKFEVYICQPCKMVFVIKEMFEAHQSE